MIVWTTAREVAFGKICSTLETQNDSYTTSGFGRDFVNEGNGVTYFRTTLTFAEGGATQGETSYGTTTNQTGYTESFSSSNSFSSSAAASSLATFTSFGSSTNETVTITNIDSYASASTSGSNSFSSSSSFGLTFAKQTTTTETIEVYGSTTSSSMGEIDQWTTVLNFSDSDATEFVLTTAVGTNYFVEATYLTRTRIVVTESGTTKGNAHDTIYMAETSEVLWAINEEPQWSKPLTDNAAPITKTTISDLRETVGLVAAVNSQSIESSASTFTSNFTSSSFGYITTTVNNSPALIGGSTAEQPIGITTSYAEPFWNSYTFLVSRQFGVFHYGNTETVPVTWETVNVPTETDVLANASWQQINTVRSTTENTASIDNTVGTFTVSGGGTASSCYGNTTKYGNFVGGFASIAPQPSMSIYGKQGVALDNNVGLLFVGGGVPSIYEYYDNDAVLTSSREFIYANLHGDSVHVYTATPVTPTSVTQIAETVTTLNNETTTIASVKFVITSNSEAKTFTTTSAETFDVDGQPWVSVIRARQNLVGGNLGEDETGLIRISRGLYKNQSGGTSFFQGNDTTYTGNMETTYWYPISYLQPYLEQNVLAVERNTSTWPTFSNMP